MYNDNNSENDNRYSFKLEDMETGREITPANHEAEQRASDTQHNGQSREMKRFAKKLIAICCALALVIGGASGLIIGNYIGSQKTDNTSYSAPEEQNTSDNSDSDSSDSAKNSSSNSNSVNSNLVYTDSSNNEEMGTSEVVKKVENTVVAITTQVQVNTTSYWYGDQSYTAEASGSGVILSSDGYIVTNNHVIDGAISIYVTTADGTSYEATLVGADDGTDMALIKIDATGLSYAELGDSESIQKGDTAIVIGNPLGYLDGSVTQGVISGYGRELDFSDGTTLYNLIQTDASVNPGNSGGGLFNTRGQLIGIVCAKTSATDVEGLGFAIPVSTVRPTVQDLRDYGYVTGRPALGIQVVEVTNTMEAMYYKLSHLGVYVASFINSDVEKNSGLEIGDCIISINDTEVTTNAEIGAVISQLNVGDTVNLEVYRDGETVSVTSVLVEQDSSY